MNQRRMARWEKMRERGRRHVVRRYGVFGWGLTTGLLCAAWMLVRHLNSGEFDRGLIILIALFAVPCFMLSGVLFGHFLWLLMEWQYKRAKAG